jgi:FixJ family two-component response regulator
VGDVQLGNLVEQDGRTGGTFRFSRAGLPDLEPAPSKAGGLKAPVLRTRKLILVVDDDPSMLKVIERTLKVHGFDADLFSSVEDFEKRANLREATCLILDINLNGASGIELRRRIAMSGISIPAVFITGNDNSTVRKAADDADCSAFLVKPFPVKSLMDAIARVTPEPGRPE